MSQTARVLSLAIILLFAHMAYFYPYTPDDTFISLRYAQRLVEGKGLTWNDGEYVEGYSNLLWVLLAAALNRLGMDLLLSVQVMGAVCSVLTLFVFAHYAKRFALPASSLAIGTITYALTAPVAIWAVGGLEMPMVMLLFAIALFFARSLLESHDNTLAIKAGCALGVICWLRPEGPLYTVAPMLALMLCAASPLKTRIRSATIVSVTAFGFFAVLLVWRLSYYGEWVPNTVLAKVALNNSRFASGLIYAGQALLSVAPALWCIHYFYQKNAPLFAGHHLRFLVIIGVFLTTAIIIAGGDWLVGYRAFVPLVAVMILLLMEACRFVVFNGKERLALGVSALLFIGIQFLNKDNLNAQMGRNWVPSTLQPIGEALKERYGKQQPLIALFTAGAIPYYSGLPTLDVYGLCDHYLTHHRHENKDFGRGLVGHDLFDADYVESRKPDLLLFDIPGIKSQCANKQEACDKLYKNYTPITLETPKYNITVWERKDSRKLGR